jgi:hypothetical protein
LAEKSEKNMFKKGPILACFLVKNPGGKKMGVKQRIFTHETDFALISTIFIRLGGNFT